MRKFGMIWALWSASTLLWVGCIAAPDVVLVEDRTALEKQAAGEYETLERRLNASVLRGGPIVVADAGGADARQSALASLTQLYSVIRADQNEVDSLLLARCIGEGLDGFLKRTPESCQEDIHPDAVAELLGRTNEARTGLWRDILARSEGSSEEEVIRKWRERNLQRVVCGGWVESTGGWESLQCER